MFKKRLLKNLNLLEFLKIDIYYHDKKYENKRNIDILDGIDISSLEKNFFLTWKQINFYFIFKNNFNDFMRKIALLIKEMKDFNLLFSFYDFYQENEYKYQSILNIQQRFVEIFNTYSKENCPNFTNEVVKLIYWSDKKMVNLNKFLKEDIQNLLDIDKVFEIYIKLIDEYEDLSKDMKEIIIEFFTINNNSNPSALLFLIKNCEKLSNEVCSNINKFIIKEEDFFRLDESKQLKFFKGLTKEKILEKVNNSDGSIYISNLLMVISSLDSKIKDFNIPFATLGPFFPDKKNDKLEHILKDRLNYIFLYEKDTGEKIFDILKQKVNEIKEKIKNLEFIYRYFSNFFYTSRSEDMKKVAEICTHLKMDNLNYFDKKCKNDYNNYLKYLEDAKIHNKKKKSKFYNEIFDIEGKKSKVVNDKDRFNETERKFNKFKNLFEKDGINKIDPKFLENYLRPFRNSKENLENKIETELKILIDIFQIKGEINISKIIEAIILIYKRKYLLDIAVGINTFIEKISKTNLIQDIKDIIQKLNESKDIDTIRSCRNKLDNIPSFFNIKDISFNLLNDNINKLKIDLEKEKKINNELSLNIKKLESILNEKEKEIIEEKRQKNELIKKINDIKNISQNNKILELIEKKEEMENEIKKLKELFPFEYRLGEKIYTVTFISSNENIHFSMICKNTDKFYRLEDAFYEKFPEYKKYNNLFLFQEKFLINLII